MKDPISGYEFKFSPKIGEDGKQIFLKKKGKYADDQSYVYTLDYVKDKDGNDVEVNFNEKTRVELRRAIKNIETFDKMSKDEQEKIINNKPGLIFIGKGQTKSGQMSNKDVVKAQLGDYKCHRDGDYIVFKNINDESDIFKYPMSALQFKRVRDTFNNKSVRNGIETNKYILDPSLLTKDVILNRIHKVLGIKNSNSSTATNTIIEAGNH